MEEVQTVTSEEVLELKPAKHKKHLSRRKSEIIFICMMLLFPIIQFIIFWIIPNFNSILLAFQKPDGSYGKENFQRFVEAIKEPKTEYGKPNEVIYAIKNSLIYFGVNIFICTPLVLFFSYVLYRKVPLSGVFKVVFYLPSIVGATVTTELFRLLFLNDGPMFVLLQKMNLIKDEEVIIKGLFSTDKTAFLMIIIYSIWTCVGLNMIMFHGAMKRIPKEIFESADIDGVGFFKQFIDIVIPLIWPTVATLIIFSLSGMFVTYGATMILAPDVNSASMIGWYIMKYTTATDNHASLYYPAAVGLIFTAVGLPFVLLVRWGLNKIGSNVEY